MGEIIDLNRKRAAKPACLAKLRDTHPRTSLKIDLPKLLRFRADAARAASALARSPLLQTR